MNGMRVKPTSANIRIAAHTFYFHIFVKARSAILER